MGKYTEITRTSTFSEDGFLERVEIQVKVKTKHCPICGGKTDTEHVYTPEGEDLVRICCQKCGTKSGLFSDIELAAQAWNRRTPIVSIKQKVVKDCPFCAGKMEFEFSDDEDIPDGYFVQCKKCGARSKVYEEAQAAANAFNRRV